MYNKLYCPYLGGVERSVYDLCEEIKSEVELTLLTVNTKTRSEVFYKNGYRVIMVASFGRAFSSLYLSPGVPAWWRRLNSDIVHFHFPSPIAELYCLTLCPRDKPLVVTYHADITGYDAAMFFYRPFLVKFLERANRIVVSSPSMVEGSPFLKRFRDKCRVVPIGIDEGRFRMTEDVKTKSQKIRQVFKKPIILYIGRLVRYKGMDYLIRAMKKIDAVLLIGGTGPEEAGLKNLAEGLGIGSERISFLGRIDEADLPVYYHASDIFVLPSVTSQEAFGIVQLEAHACSKPVVSTNLSTGVPFANLDGVTGIIVPPRSSDMLAEAINKLLSDSGLRRRLGAQAKERVDLQFTRSIMSQKVLKIYKELL